MTKLLRLAVLPVLIYYLLQGMEYVKDVYLPQFFMFDPKILQELSQEAIAEHPNTSDPSLIFTSLHEKLRDTYGDYIEDLDPEKWMFSNAGGAMGNFIILHATLFEYLIIFGSATGTEGHSGYHLADDYFTILYGEQRAANRSQTVPSIYKPGDINHMPYGEIRQYSLPGPKGGYALELAQGYIPTMLIFGFADSVFSTVDPINLYRQILFTLQSMYKNILKGKF